MRAVHRLICLGVAFYLCPVPVWATSCARAIHEHARLHVVEAFRQGASIDPVQAPRSIAQNVQTGDVPNLISVGSSARLSLVSRIEPSSETKIYLDQWRGKTTGKDDACPSLPYMPLEPGRYGPEILASGPTDWIKDGLFTISADRRSADHSYRLDGVDFVVKYRMEVQRFEEDGNGCTLSNQNPRSALACFLATLVFSYTRRPRRGEAEGI